jgi:hypothetical protein
MLGFFPAFKIWKFGPGTVLQPQFRVCCMLLTVDCIIISWSCAVEVQWCQSEVLIAVAVYCQLSGEIAYMRFVKAHGTSCLCFSMFLVQRCMIMNHGYKLPNIWWSYIMQLPKAQCTVWCCTFWRSADRRTDSQTVLYCEARTFVHFSVFFFCVPFNIHKHMDMKLI